jgi:undecaprenyl-diphosphatase
MLGALFAINLLLPQLARGQTTLDAVANADWRWLPSIALASAATYLTSAVALMGAARGRLALGRTWTVQVASAFTNRLAPAGIGGMTTNVRYLTATGMGRPEAVAAVGMNSIAGLAVHLAAVLAVVPLLGASHAHIRFSGPDFPDRWPLLLAVIATFVAAGVPRWGALARKRLGPAWHEGVQAVASMARNPRAALVLVCGAAGITACYTTAFYFSTRAFGLGLPLATVAAVYLGGSMAAAAAPTPGGLGAVEAALVAGLTVAGAPSGPAVACVLTYRLVTYWAPVIPGALFFRVLRRAGTI